MNLLKATFITGVLYLILHYQKDIEVIVTSYAKYIKNYSQFTKQLEGAKVDTTPTQPKIVFEEVEEEDITTTEKTETIKEENKTEYQKSVDAYEITKLSEPLAVLDTNKIQWLNYKTYEGREPKIGRYEPKIRACLIGKSRRVLYDYVNHENAVEISKIVKNKNKIAVGIKLAETVFFYLDASYINF